MHAAYTRKNRRHFIVSLAALGISTLVHSSPPQRILVLGDSLSAEYGLARGTGWVALLEKKLAEEQRAVQVINASVSGETTAGGRARLSQLLKQHSPDIVLIELGGNDALRGLPLSGTQDNLRWMTQSAQATGAKVMLLGMQMPPNYGKKYAEEFAQIYEQVAQTHNAVLLPFFLKNVADTPEAAQLFQPDRIHPNAQAQSLMLANVWPLLRPLLARTR